MRAPEEPVCIDIFRQNPVFTSLHLKSPVHVHRLWSQLDIPAICVSISAAVTLKRLSTYTVLNFNVNKWAVFSDTFFKYFSNNYVYVEAAPMTAGCSFHQSPQPETDSIIPWAVI
jgi:hypothetical protein